MVFWLPVFLLLLVMPGLVLLQSPLPVSGQGIGPPLGNPACRQNPHGQECICAEVRRFGYFPKEFDIYGVVDTDGDGFSPSRTDEGVWVDHEEEGDDGVETELAFVVDDRYSERCALSYFREDQRRLWHFAVALGPLSP